MSQSLLLDSFPPHNKSINLPLTVDDFPKYSHIHLDYSNKDPDYTQNHEWAGVISSDNWKTCFEIQIKYLPGATELKQLDVGDWIDLVCYEDTKLKTGERTYISLGVAMKLPDGFEAIMAPRSSTFKRYGILQTNSIGVIDNSYSGNDDVWMFPAYATKDIEIPAGTRICQFRIQPIQPKVSFKRVDCLGENRGGLGSTGI